MKYLSLIGLMSMYGSGIKDRHSMYNLNHQVTNIGIQAKEDFNPFIIETGTNEKNYMTDANPEQVMNKLTSNNIIAHANFILDTFIVPPILEIEWLKNELGLDDEYVEVMNQLGYAYMVWIMTWIYYTNTDTDRWLSYMEEQKAIIEVEDIEDAPYILIADPMPNVTLPKIRNWSDVLVYGSDFPSVYRKCVNQAVAFKELYHQIPVILAIFMRDYCGNKLNNWSKALCLSIENEVQDYLIKLEGYRTNDRSIYTYSLSSGITNKDRDLISNVLTIICDKLHSINAKIGLISYTNYENIRGPEKINASVRLTGMNIKWNDEICKANEKKKQELTDAESDDEDLFDGF